MKIRKGLIGWLLWISSVAWAGAPVGYIPPKAAEAKAVPDMTPSQLESEKIEQAHIKYSVIL